MTLEEAMPIAEKAAAEVSRKGRGTVDYEDMLQSAVLYLLEHPRYLERYKPGAMRFAIVKHLVRVAEKERREMHDSIDTEGTIW